MWCDNSFGDISHHPCSTMQFSAHQTLYFLSSGVTKLKKSLSPPQDITDVEEMSQTLSTDFDASTNSSNMASCSTSPSSYYTSCSDLNLIRKCTRASPAISGSSSMDMQQKPKRHSGEYALSDYVTKAQVNSYPSK